ncbi:MAG: copper amine oxidase N-terminal domain-containing protein [Deltaproteobacteria bacterium]
MGKSLLLSVTILIILLLTGTASAETAVRDVRLVIGDTQAQINGRTVQMPAPARIVNGSTLVPLRFVGEALGCQVSWESSSQTAMVKMIDQTIEVQIGASYASVNGGRIDVKVPAQIINGSTYVPLRFISESLGARVDYTEGTKMVSISLAIYRDKENGFQVVTPAGWSVSPSYDDGIDIARDEKCFGHVGYFDSREGIDTGNFAEFAEQWFTLYEDETIKTRYVRGITAVVVFSRDGEINIIAYKLLDRGVYSCCFSIAEDEFDSGLALQADVIMGTLTSPVD